MYVNKQIIVNISGSTLSFINKLGQMFMKKFMKNIFLNNNVDNKL